MLKFNFARVIRARGIAKPYSYLLRHGYASNTASRIANNKMESLNLQTVENLCELFKCTPNDLLEWTPGNNDTDVEHHPLHPLLRQNTVVELTQLLNSIPLDKLEAIKAKISEEIKK